MTWATSSQPTFVAGQLGTYGLTSTGTTSTRLVYDIITPYTPWNSAVSGNGGGGNGLVFTFANNTITLHCNDSAAGDTDHPAVASNITTSGAAASSITVSEGDTVSLKISAGSSIGNFTVPTFTAASTTSTESVNVVTWTPSFVDNGTGYITATITGTPASAFGTGFVAANFKLYKSSGISNQTQVSTTVEFLANTTITSQFRTFFRDSGYVYYYRNAATGQLLAPYITMTGGRRSNSNFW